MPKHYFIETIERFKETVTTEVGVDTLEEAEAYLNSLGYPHHVIKEAINNLGYGDNDSAYVIKISILE